MEVKSLLDIGKKINDRYLIIGNIGSGGMANVFLARDLILDREVAVKVLRYDFQNDQQPFAAFSVKRWLLLSSSIRISSLCMMSEKKTANNIW